MTNFKDLGITAPKSVFIGDKVELTDVLNNEITVCDYSVTDSKYTDKGDGKRLNLQLKINNVDKVWWTGSLVLREMMLQVPKDKLPITTTIVKKNRRFEFT